MKWPHVARTAAVSLAITVTAAACGGGSDSASTEEDVATSTTTTSADDDSTTTQAPTTTEPIKGDSGSEYCDRVREAQDSNESPLDFSFFNKTPEELEAQFAANLEIFEEWQATSPPEIEADTAVILDFYRLFADRGNELNWNLEAMADDEVFNNAFDNPELDSATANVDNYTLNTCGVDFNEGDGSPPATGTDDALGDALESLGIPIPVDFLSEESLECLTEALAPLLEQDIGPGYVPTDDDIALLTDALDTCNIG